MDFTTTEDRILRQAKITGHDLLVAAKHDIDEVFEEDGYAKKHSELVSAYLIAAGLDNHAMLQLEPKKK